MSKEQPEMSYNKQETAYKDNQLEGFNITKKQCINSMFAIFYIICAYTKWWQAEKSKQTSEQNKAKQKNIE